jgi:DNA-3-methyladenine glycosylase
VTPDKVRGLLSRASWEVAPELIGWTLTHEAADGPVTVEITETEAYAGPLDPASHAYRGPTPRNRVMFGPAGYLYVYLSYGMHWCANITTGPDGEASAVLLRAGAVVAGASVAMERRGNVRETALARGPGNLGRALGLTGALSGSDVLRSPSLRLQPPGTAGQVQVASGPRIGITKATELPWRFWRQGDPTVSATRR